MRFRIGMIKRKCGNTEIKVVKDWIDNVATVKGIIRHAINNQTSYELAHNSFFAEILSDGVWRNISDYWNNLAEENVELGYMYGEITKEKFDRFFEKSMRMRYADSGEVDYILDYYGRFETWYMS